VPALCKTAQHLKEDTAWHLSRRVNSAWPLQKVWLWPITNTCVTKQKKMKANTLSELALVDALTEEDLKALQVSIRSYAICTRFGKHTGLGPHRYAAWRKCERSRRESMVLTVDVFSKKKIESLKMGGLLAVNKGSLDDPAFIVWSINLSQCQEMNKPLILVGKGVVYDTGGLSLKPTAYMEDMKCDMGGGATVIATMSAVAEAKLPLHVIGLVPATDNRPGGNAVTPGDVITISDGTTVEVMNTDAEGRLILERCSCTTPKSMIPNWLLISLHLPVQLLVPSGHMAL
jgi:leucyl aminopeptidase